MGDLARFLDSSEVRCRCGCGLTDVERELVELFSAIRDGYAHPITIRSGVRCERHNRRVGGEIESTHVPWRDYAGRALDLNAPTPADRYELAHLAMDAGCKRIGVSASKGIVHIDVAKEAPWLFPREPFRLWTYERG